MAQKSQRKIRIGAMSFGQIDRQLYNLSAQSDNLEVVAIADIAKPEILHYLLTSDSPEGSNNTLEGNYLVNPHFRARMMQTASCSERFG